MNLLRLDLPDVGSLGIDMQTKRAVSLLCPETMAWPVLFC